MSTYPSSPSKSAHGFELRFGPFFVAIAGLMMLLWTWNTWADPLVDFGTQLYIPWQIVSGKVLYRDIAYYNGPLSQYFNAAAFAILGVGLRTLVWTNLACLTLLIVLIYRLTSRAVGSLAAVVVSLAFIILFAFNQFVGVSNYNWVTPYTNEITHGAILGLISIALLNHFHSTRQSRWLVVSGIALGLTFLTKAEPFAASIAAVIAQIAADLWQQRPGFKTAIHVVAIFFGCALLIPIIAILLFALAMPLPTAALAIAGSWRWVFDLRVARLPFYTHVQGTDHISSNFARILRWLIAYVVVLAPAIFIAVRTSRRRAVPVSIVIFLILFGLLFWQSDQIDWSAITLPLPICMAIISITIILQIIGKSSREGSDFAQLNRSGQGGQLVPAKNSLRLSLTIFSLVLLLKVIFNARLGHYGFVLTAGGALVMTAILAEGLPKWIDHRGGSGMIVQAVALAVGLIIGFQAIRVDEHFFQIKQWTLGTPPDMLRCDVVGLEVGQMDDLIQHFLPPDGTLAVFPQGLMLNYLTRHRNPSRYLNFMPPEVLAAGEGKIINDLERHPPDAIVINSSSVRGDEFTLDTDYSYGRETFAWVKQHYEPIAAVQLPPPYHTVLHLVLMRPRSNPPVPENR